MSWRCDSTGKKPLSGHKVSHSNIKTKRRFMPNLQSVTLISEALGRSVRARISTNALRTVDHRGGLDAFLLKAKDAQLAPEDAGAQAPDRRRRSARSRLRQQRTNPLLFFKVVQNAARISAGRRFMFSETRLIRRPA